MINYELLYGDAGVQSTKLTLQPAYDERPGFFNSFKSIDDFVMQVKAPIIMPIICLSVTLHAAINFVKHVLLCVPNLLVGDFHQVNSHIRGSASNAYDFFEGIFRAVIDTVWELTVLMTRLVATCFYAVVAEPVENLSNSNVNFMYSYNNTTDDGDVGPTTDYPTFGRPSFGQ